MKLVTLNLHPTAAQLRQFGWIGLAAFPLLGYAWGGFHPSVPWLGAALGTACGGLALAWPRGLKPLFLALSIVVFPVGLVVGEIAMAVTFYALFAPLGLMFRLLGRDALQRKFDRQASTYWQAKRQPQGPASYLRQW